MLAVFVAFPVGFGAEALVASGVCAAVGFFVAFHVLFEITGAGDGVCAMRALECVRVEALGRFAWVRVC